MSPVPTTTLHGRDQERRAIAGLCADPGRGPGLLLTGEPGIGTSALLASAAEEAVARGVRVLRVVSPTGHDDRPLALLHELLAMLREHRPLTGDSLDALLGDVLTAMAAERPTVLLLDDAQRADDASWEALTRVVRRLHEAPLALLATLPDGHPHTRTAGLAVLHLGPLDPAASAAVLDDCARDLPTFVRERILEAAVGNPLALRELATASADEWRRRCVRPPVALPLTPRLVDAFTAPARALPEIAQEVLLAAAASDSEDLSEAVQVAARTLGVPTEEALAACLPAFEQRLVEGGTTALRFRSEVARSALYHAAALPRRHAIHTAFVALLDAGQPHRAAWHRAAASLAPDERLAAALELASRDSRGRGRIRDALATMDRAARVSEVPAAQVPRLLDAAEMAFEIGRPDFVTTFLEQASARADDAEQRRRIGLLQSLYDLWRPEGAHAALALAELAEQAHDAGDAVRTRTLLTRLVEKANVCPAEELPKAALLAVATRMGGPEAVPALTGVLSIVAPIEHGTVLLDAIGARAPDGDGDPRLARVLADAAMTLGDDQQAVVSFSAAIAWLRREGRLGLLPFALVDRARAHVAVGTLDVAVTDADEAAQLAAESAQPVLLGRARAVQALIAGLRGEAARAGELAAEAERMAVGRPALLTDVHVARGVTALADERYEEACEWLLRLWEPGVPMLAVSRRWAVIGELVEAAVACGRGAEVHSLVDELTVTAAAVPSPRLRAGVRLAQALLAADAGDVDAAEHAFLAARQVAGAQGGVAAGRLHLAYGAWLRRAREIKQARMELRAAVAAFTAAGADGWGARATRELRAAGAPVAATAAGVDDLTAQEREIAELAAAGLTNREIGQRLFLSHRTISTHLYRVYPKLGVTSRAQLRDALGSAA